MVRQRNKRRRVWRLGIFVGLTVVTLMMILVLEFGPVVIAYRFNPVLESPEQSVSRDSQILHRSLTIADLHADSLLWGRDLSQVRDDGHLDIPRLLQGNVALQTFMVVTKVPSSIQLENNRDRSDDIIKLALLQQWPLSTWFSLQERALYQAQQLQSLEKRAAGLFRIIRTRQDLKQYLAEREQNKKMTAGLLGLEGAQALEGDLEAIDHLYDAGFRIIGLAHFFDNEVSGSVHGIERGGVTPFGRTVIQRMEALNMTIDLAHASAQTIDDVLQITNRPVIVSHTGVRGTCDNARNLSDQQLRGIAQTGGVIGIGFWPTAVCGQDANAIAKAIRYAVAQVGIDHVALGSDFDGAVRMPFDAAHLNQLTHALVQAGFTEIEIEKIMGLNIVRLLETVLPI